MAESPGVKLFEKGLDDLGDEITCPICREHFHEPKILPCLHYYCKECIRNLARRQHPFQCPECRRDTNLPQNDPDQLPTAFFVNRMKEVHAKMEKIEGKVEATCEMCFGAKAGAFCRQCMLFICTDCVQAHQKMKVFAGHQIVTLEELKLGGPNRIPINEIPPTLCKEHDEPWKIFCFDCNRLICRDCVIDGHTDHKREFIKKYAVQCRTTVSDSLVPLKQVQADINQSAKDIESTENDISTQHDNVSSIIHQSFAKMVDILKQREQHLLDKASEFKDKKLNALRSQNKNLRVIKAETQSLIEFVEHSLANATDEEVVSIHQQILARIDEEHKRCKQTVMVPNIKADVAVEISDSSSTLMRIGRVYITKSCSAPSPRPDVCSSEGMYVHV